MRQQSSGVGIRRSGLGVAARLSVVNANSITTSGQPITLTDNSIVIAIREDADHMPDAYAQDDGSDEVYSPPILWHIAGCDASRFAERDEFTVDGKEYRVKRITQQKSGGRDAVVVMATLTTREISPYESLCDLYRPQTNIDNVTGAPGDTVPVLAYTNIPCHYLYTPNLDDATGVGGVKRPTVFTTDTIFFKVAQTVGNGWWVRNRTAGPNLGEVHKILGDAVSDRAIDRRTVTRRGFLAMVEEHPLAEITG